MDIDTPCMKRIPLPTRNVPWYKRMWRWLAWPLKWEITADYIQEIGDRTYFIPKGFVFDGASVPRIFWAILSPVGLLLVQGLLHDFAYKYGFLWLVKLGQNGEIVKKWKFGGGEQRVFWDTLFHALGALVNGMSVVNWIAWLGVRAGGWVAWRGYRKRDLEVGRN